MRVSKRSSEHVEKPNVAEPMDGDLEEQVCRCCGLSQRASFRCAECGSYLCRGCGSVLRVCPVCRGEILRLSGEEEK